MVRISVQYDPTLTIERLNNQKSVNGTMEFGINRGTKTISPP